MASNYLRPGARKAAEARTTKSTGVLAARRGVAPAIQPSKVTSVKKTAPTGLGGKSATKSHALLSIKKPAKATQATPGTPPGRTIKAPAPLGPQAQKQVTHAESAASRVIARQRDVIGITRSVFPSLYGNDGRPPQVPGMRKQTIRQLMLNPYRNSFAFGTAKF